MKVLIAFLAPLSLLACSKPAAPTAAASSGTAASASADTAADGMNQQTSGTAALKPEHRTDAGAPASGANSFTMSEARQHIEHSGYTNVAGLAKDSNGVWRATATKGGQTVNVALDFKGDVSTQ